VGVLDVVGPAIADNAIARAMTGDIKAAGHLLLMLACGGTAAPSLEMCSVSALHEAGAGFVERSLGRID
jgi:hypothetical protein